MHMISTTTKRGSVWPQFSPDGSRSGAAGRYDRVFYSGIAIAMALTVFVGFGPTYYFGAFGAGPRRWRR